MGSKNKIRKIKQGKDGGGCRNIEVKEKGRCVLEPGQKAE